MAYPYPIGTFKDNPVLPYAAKVAVRGSSIYQSMYTYVSGTNYVLSMWKSTDDGVTWVEQDAAGRVDVSRTAAYDVISEHDKGSSILFAYLPDGAFPPTETDLVEFDTTTDTWGTPITGGPAPVNAITTASPSPGAQLGNRERSDGSVVLIHSDVFTPPSTVDKQGLKFSVRSGGSWGSAQDLLVPGSTESFEVQYILLGLVLMASDRIRVFAWTEYGFASIDIEADDSLTNYRRFDQSSTELTAGVARLEVWGLPQLVTICDVEYTALPIAQTTNVDNPAGTQVRPGLLLMEASASPASAQFLMFDEMIRLEGDWLSVSVSYDESTDTLYLAWTRKDHATNDSEIRYSCFRGKTWAAPSTLYTVAYGDPGGWAATMEITASDGVMRVMTYDGGSPDGTPHYWQAAATCSADACASGGSSSFYGVI